ncbi:hypothetical protein O181_006125 [Austropuccinia psidii MF-1]|uniref:CSD domain-containing protein n=1 Tax=Austropuccinia psidii MF-1 TaxID=1389203 RepID=A0A9Q3BKC3_9BASI|nr:hypothetical protein [Austropuccinia psidii MF-1]
MSITLDSLALDGQTSTPTPGSPRPYINSDNHDRLDSIQLSSDASGEFSIAPSPRSFLGSPGEALSELRNARNPPWLHGPSGTPPSFLGISRVERAAGWAEEAFRLAEQPTLDITRHADLTRLSLSHGLILTRDLPRVLPQPSQTPLMSTSDLISKPSLNLATTLLQSSPFDKPADGIKRVDGHDRRAITSSTAQSLQKPFKPHDVPSGDGSSEEGEAWPMPETPFLTNDVWTTQSKRGKENLKDNPVNKVKVASLSQSIAVAPAPEHSKSTSHHRKMNNENARARGLMNQCRAKEGERRVGRCKMYNCDKGVGFLIDDRLDQVPYDVKIHWTDLYSDQEFKSLAKGEIVEYTLNITPNGYSASYVTGPGGRPVMGAEQTIVQASRQTSYKLFKAGALPVKTYRSKWENVPATGFLESSNAQSINGTAILSNRSSLPQRVNQTASGTLKSISSTSSVTVDLHAPNHSAQKMASTNMRSGMGLPGKNDNPIFSQDRSHLSGPGRNIINYSPTTSFSPHVWPSIQSPVNVLNSLQGSLTPLPGLSHSVLTPNSVESYNSMLFGGYTPPHHPQSIRSPTIALNTPGNPNHHLITNRMFNQVHPALKHSDLHSLMAERQMLLQHQAALMNLYQNVTQPSPSATIQPLNQFSAQNALKPSSGILTREQQNYYGSNYDGLNGLIDPQTQRFGLLPPITLPGNQNNQGGHESNANQITTSSENDEMNEFKLESVASLRPSAQAFTPATTDISNSLGETSSQTHEQDVYELGNRVNNGLLYQVPGRRSVSDPASTTTCGSKKPNLLIYSPSRPQKSHCTTTLASNKQTSEKAINSKRVTFAELAGPTQKVGSHGETPLTQVNCSNSDEAFGLEVAERIIESNGDLNKGTKPLGNLNRTNETSNLDEIRRAGDVKSVEIAMERLREAAAPRRLSFRNNQSNKAFTDTVENIKSESQDVNLEEQWNDKTKNDRRQSVSRSTTEILASRPESSSSTMKEMTQMTPQVEV